MSRKLIQSVPSEGYTLQMAPPENFNLIDEIGCRHYIREHIEEELRRNILLFYEREGLVPTCISVDGTIQSYYRDYLEVMDLDGRKIHGELRKIAGSYQKDPYILIEDKEGNEKFTHVSSKCEINRSTGITLTYSFGVED